MLWCSWDLGVVIKNLNINWIFHFTLIGTKKWQSLLTRLLGRATSRKLWPIQDKHGFQVVLPGYTTISLATQVTWRFCRHKAYSCHQQIGKSLISARKDKCCWYKARTIKARVRSLGGHRKGHVNSSLDVIYWTSVICKRAALVVYDISNAIVL